MNFTSGNEARRRILNKLRIAKHKEDCDNQVSGAGTAGNSFCVLHFHVSQDLRSVLRMTRCLLFLDLEKFASVAFLLHTTRRVSRTTCQPGAGLAGRCVLVHACAACPEMPPPEAGGGGGGGGPVKMFLQSTALD